MAVRERYDLRGAGQTVAVIDTGIAWNHVALGEGFGPGYRVVGGWDFAENDPDPYDDPPAGYHGTHVAGLVGGQSDLLQGVAPDADLVALRVFDDRGQNSLAWIESALQWVYANRDAFQWPITTVNLSLGIALSENLAAEVYAQFEDELALLREAEIVVVAAAGNQFRSDAPAALQYPAASQSVWAVASTESSGALSSFSQRNDSILATVGRALHSSVPDHVIAADGNVDDYLAVSGTSMAAPQIAGAAVLLRQAAESVGIDTTPDSLRAILAQTATTRIDPLTGLTYHDVNLLAAIEAIRSRAPHPTSDLALDGPTSPPSLTRPPIDGGIVAWGSTSLDPAQSLLVRPARDGIFSVVAEDPATSLAAVRIHDSHGNLLWNGAASSANQIDLTVRGAEPLIFSTTQSSPAQLRFANVVHVAGDHLELATGTAEAPVQVDSEEGLRLTIERFVYRFAPGQIATGILDGGEGADRLSLRGSEATGRITLNPYQDGHWQEGSIQFVLRGFEQVQYQGGGGNDRAYLYDTQGNDTLVASPGEARLEGVGFRYEVTDVVRTFVHATAGGHDVAFLHDSSGDDQLAVRPQFVSLRNGNFFNSAVGFERVHAYATGGGFDVAQLYDSAGNDRLTASSAATMISGPGYYVQARGFDSITGHSSAGGQDLATLYADGAGENRWVRTSDQTTLRSDDGMDRTARGFARVETYEAGSRVSIPLARAMTTPEPTAAMASPTAIADFYTLLQNREREILDKLFADRGFERQ